MHRLYLAGHPLQGEWSRLHPLHLSRIFDLASHLRRECSGRELPRYVVRTELGDVDFGIGGEVVDGDGRGGVRMRLVAFDLEYYRSLDPVFELPEGVELDDDGHPIVTVEGMLA
jgi:hypothetical protein